MSTTPGTQTPGAPLKPNFERAAASAAHHAAASATNFEEYTAGVELDEFGRLPVGAEVIATPYYQTITGVPAGTRGKVTWLFMNHTTPTFEVQWDAHEADYKAAPAEERAWFVAADILRYDLLGKFTRVEFYAEYWEGGRMKHHPFPSLREAARWILDNADWSNERVNLCGSETGCDHLSCGDLTRIHSGLYMPALGGRYSEGVERVGLASNYCRRALEVAVETNNWRTVIQVCKVERLSYDE